MAFNTSNAPFDPVDAFFSGFTSFFSRIFLGWVALFLGCALCYFCGPGFGTGVLYAWALGLIGMIFMWALWGGWFILGLAALITLFFCLWRFVNDCDGKLNFFLMFTASVIYFFPLDIGDGYEDSNHWLRTVIVFSIVAACYWLLPLLIATLMPAPVEEVVRVTPLPTENFTPMNPDFQEFDPTPLDPTTHPHELDSPSHLSDTIPSDFENTSGENEHTES